MEQRSASELRRSVAIRVGVAVGLAAALTAGAIAVAWGPFETRTDVIGHPVYDAFNVQNYLTAYYLVVGAFPVAALLLFLGLSRIGPRVGLPVSPDRGPLRPAPAAPETSSPLDPEVRVTDPRAQGLLAAARIGFVAALIGLEAGIAADSILLGLLLGAPAYVFAVFVIAALAGRWRGEWDLQARRAAVNSLGAPLAVAGLVAVSSITGVRIPGDGSTEHYPWFPAWLGLPVAAALGAVVLTALHRAASPFRVPRIERASLMLVAAPVCLFVLTASLQVDTPSFYGDSPATDLFHSGEQLVGARLVADGWFPWRDVVLSHGLLLDVAAPLAGQEIFGGSRWGNGAGLTMLLHPLYLVAFYFLCVYLFGRNWLFLLFTGLLAVGTWLGPEIPDLAGNNFRFVLWPLILLVLAAALQRPTAVRSVGLAFLVFAQALVTPEAAPTAVAVALVLVLYEWYWRSPGASVASAFPRSLRFAAAGIVLAGVFAALLASAGALDDFLYVNTALVQGHALKGGIPPATFLAPDALFYFAALAPPAAVLIFAAYSVTRLRLRRALRTEDWVMAAVAISVLLYFPKFLARMDLVHLNQAYSLALPLLLYLAYLGVQAADRVTRASAPASLAVRLTAHPVSLALVAVVAALASYQLGSRISDAAASYRPSGERPQLARLGYQSRLDLAAYRDLKRVIDAYLGPHDRLLDFTNEPALFFYLIDRDPSTRWFTAALTLTEETQQDQVRRLMRTPPKLVVFDATSGGGLSNWDGIPTIVRDYEVSRWILDRYRPLLVTQSHTVYARRDQPAAAQKGLELGVKPVTRGVEFQSQRCNWGKAPSFLSEGVLPEPGAPAAGARLRRISATTLRIDPPAGLRWEEFGWLGLEPAASGFGNAEVTVNDRLRGQFPGREIAFETVESSPRGYLVPVASCPQWHGYRGPLYLESDRPQDISAVRLIR